MTSFATRVARFEPAMYAVLRAAFGIVLFTHGLPKALGASHGSMGDPMAGSIRLIGEVMGLPFAPQLAFLVMLLETVGAAMLTLGMLTRGVALLFACEMAGISLALGPTWPWIDRGIEYPVLMGFLALYVAARDGGAYSVDGFQRRPSMRSADSVPPPRAARYSSKPAQERCVGQASG